MQATTAHFKEHSGHKSSEWTKCILSAFVRGELKWGSAIEAGGFLYSPNYTSGMVHLMQVTIIST